MYSHKEIDFDNKFVCLGKRFPVLQLVVSSAYSHPMELKLRIPTPWPYPGLGRGKSSDYRSLLSQNFLGFVAPIVSLTVRQGYPRVQKSANVFQPFSNFTQFRAIPCNRIPFGNPCKNFKIFNIFYNYFRLAIQHPEPSSLGLSNENILGDIPPPLPPLKPEWRTQLRLAEQVS